MNKEFSLQVSKEKVNALKKKTHIKAIAHKACPRWELALNKKPEHIRFYYESLSTSVVVKVKDIKPTISLGERQILIRFEYELQD